MQLHHPATLPPGLSPAEFEQLAHDVFALVQRDRVYAEIDAAALTGKTFDPAETAQIRQLLALYFGELAGRAVDEQTTSGSVESVVMRDWRDQNLRHAA